jgi:hypothetical protein
MRFCNFMPIAFGAALILAHSANVESFAQNNTKTKTAPSVASKDASAEFEALLERLRKENSGEYEKVRRLAENDLYYGAVLAAGSMNPRFYLNHFRRYVAAGAPWIINWDFLFSTKLGGDEIEPARREVRQVLRDYQRVKDRMGHRFVHADGSGYTWTDDRDKTKVVWLLKNGPLPGGRKGDAGQAYLIEAK